MGEIIGLALTGLWSSMAIFFLVYETRTLERRSGERDYLIEKHLNGARLRLAKSLVQAAWIGVIVNIANLVLGIVVILISRTLFVAVATPLVLLGGMLGMNLRSYLGGQVLTEIADMEEVKGGSKH